MTHIAHLEQLVTSLAIEARGPSQIASETGLSVKSIEKLLENVNRKISTAAAAERERP